MGLEDEILGKTPTTQGIKEKIYKLGFIAI